MENADTVKIIKGDKRILAGAISILAYILTHGILSFIFTGKLDDIGSLPSWLLIISYIVIFHWYLGYTIGMKVFGLKFIDAKTGLKPSIVRIVVRFIVSFLRLTILGTLIAIITYSTESGYYWDRWTGIKVVYAKY